ncbi:MAG: hypothetical protein IKM48_06520 [Clostridia bacterium]|nr:hypothetical protein [Clostridia bacterium]
MKDFDKYNQERQAIIKEYRGKKMKTCLPILIIGAIVVLAIYLIGGVALSNIPVTAVLMLIAGIFTIIYLRIKVVTVNHALQKKLHDFEDQALLKY